MVHVVHGPPAQAVPVSNAGARREPTAALPVAPGPIPPPEQSQAHGAGGCALVPVGRTN